MDRLKNIYENEDFETYEKAVKNSYKDGNITAVEIGELPKTPKTDDNRSL